MPEENASSLPARENAILRARYAPAENFLSLSLQREGVKIGHRAAINLSPGISNENKRALARASHILHAKRLHRSAASLR